MNLNNNIERIKNNKSFDSENRALSELGFKKYFRKIVIFIKEKKNMYNIQNNDVITNVGCLITNISKDVTDIGTIYNKTVYLCELEYPEIIKEETVSKNITACLDKCVVRPMYAFSYNIVEKSCDTFIDLGLSLIDLSLNKSTSFGIINFSSDQQPMYRDIIYKENYNPMFYSRRHLEMNGFKGNSRELIMEDIVDGNTKIIYNKSKVDTVMNFKQNRLMQGIIIDKETISLNEYMTDFFTSFIFLPFELIEFVYDSRQIKKLNITLLTSFLKFKQKTIDYYITELFDKINKHVEILKDKLKSDIYLITRVSDQFMICDLYIYKGSNVREIRMTKPLHRQYCEYAIDSEMIVNDVEMSGEIAKLDYIDKSMKELGFTKDITSAIDAIESATKSIAMLVEENKQNMSDKFIGNDAIRLIGNDNGKT